VALPLVMAVCILIAAGVMFYFGRSSESFGQRAAFVAFAGLLVLLTGAFLMADGLQLPITESITPTDGGGYTIGYVTMTNTEGSSLFVLSNTIFWFGAVILLYSLVHSVMIFKKDRRAARYEEAI